MAKRDLQKEFREKVSKFGLREITILLMFADFLNQIKATPAEEDTLLKEFREKVSKEFPASLVLTTRMVSLAREAVVNSRRAKLLKATRIARQQCK